MLLTFPHPVTQGQSERQTSGVGGAGGDDAGAGLKAERQRLRRALGARAGLLREMDCELAALEAR